MSYYDRNYYRPSMFGGFSFFPPVIKWLLITNGGVFLLMMFMGSFRLDGVPLGYVITEYFALLPLGAGFLPWQLVTYQFMHGGFWHLFFNMFFGLWMFGMEVEHMWGSRKFLFFYLMCGVVAGIVQLVLGPILERPSIVVGASGAVYGVLVAFGMMFPDRYIFLYFLIPIKVKYFVIFLIAVGLFSIGTPTDVANLAHLGGALAGYMYVLYDRKRLPLDNVFHKVRRWWESYSVTQQRPQETDPEGETKVFDIRDGSEIEQQEMQKRIDDILDKIGHGGYQSLTEEEKRILFDASKKIN
ncbi:MAG: rhomboid family intramembrane serine protease [Ignavibacteriales bacterium]|nr:rhomboid family intramembrane serine protease [Ignavibacteriales bacterium]